VIPKAKDELMSVKAAAQKCGRNAETVRRWIWSGKLPAEKLGNQLFIKKSAFESYCRETAVREYKAGARPSGTSGATGKMREDLMNENETESRLRTFARIEKTKELISARMGRDFTEQEIDDIMQKMRDEEAHELSEIIQRDTITRPPVNRSDLIKKMRDLRKQIRARMGRDFSEDEIDDILHITHEGRDNEISGLC
jgi:excisionase family DNA binding protein